MSSSENRSYEFGSFRLVPAECLLLRDGQPVSLTPKCFDLLVVFVQNGNRLMEKDELLRKVWPDQFVEEGNLSFSVSTLRRTLGEGVSGQRYIETVPKRGYRFVADISEGQFAVPPPPRERRRVVRPVASEEAENNNTPRSSQVLDATDKGETRNRRLPLLLISGLLLLVAILCYAAWRVRPEAPSSVAEVKSIAVLPFKTVGGEAGEEYLGIGMAEVLISKLSNIKRIIVRPTSAVMKYANATPDPASAGRSLSVDAVLDGRVQHVGDRVRVTVQLVSVKDSATLWAETFDDTFANIFAVQDSISERVAQSFALQLSGNEKLQMAKRHTENLEAFQFYLKGRYFWNKRTEDGIETAISYFSQAVSLDPKYALAYSGLADAYAVLNHYDPSPNQWAFPRAQAAVQKALELDDTLAEAHAARAVVKYNYEWDWQGAEQEFQRAIALNPNYATAHHWYAECLLYQGRFDEGVAEIERAYALDPVSLIVNTERAAAYLWRRQTDQAMVHYRKALELEPNFSTALYGLGLCYEQQSRYEEAFATYRKIRSLTGLSSLGYAYAVSGRKDDARAALLQLQQMRKQHHTSAYFIALVQSGLGEQKQALTSLESAYEDRDARLVLLKVDPHFDRLRSEPRFKDLLRRINLGT